MGKIGKTTGLSLETYTCIFGPVSTSSSLSDRRGWNVDEIEIQSDAQ